MLSVCPECLRPFPRMEIAAKRHKRIVWLRAFPRSWSLKRIAVEVGLGHPGSVAYHLSGGCKCEVK